MQLNKQLIVDTLHQQLRSQAESHAAHGYYDEGELHEKLTDVTFDGRLNLQDLAEAIVVAHANAQTERSVEYRLVGDGRVEYMERMAVQAPEKAAAVLRTDSRTLDFLDHFRLTAAPEIISLLADRPFTVVDNNAETILSHNGEAMTVRVPALNLYRYDIVFGLSAAEHVGWAKTLMEDFWALVTAIHTNSLPHGVDIGQNSKMRDVEILHRSAAGDTKHDLHLFGMEISPNRDGSAYHYTLRLNSERRIPATLIGEHNHG